MQAEYTFPITASMDIFGRGLYSYYKSNVNDPNNAYDNVDAYGLLNLYAGLRSGDGVWEVALFARNVTDTEEVLNRGSSAAATHFSNALAGGAGGTIGRPVHDGVVHSAARVRSQRSLRVRIALTTSRPVRHPG